MMNKNEKRNVMLKKAAAAVLSAGIALTPVLSLAQEYMVVQGGRLNLREEASLDAKVLGQYATGTWIEVTEKGDQWSKVKVDGKSGFMMSKYLKTPSEGKMYYVRTNTGIGLNLRDKPSMDGSIITSYPIGTKVNVLEKGAVWSYVEAAGNKGYMYTAYLSESQLPSYTKPVEQPYTAKLVNINGGKVVNFRLYPGMKTKILRELPVGTQVKVLETGENWSKVEFEGQQGYVSTYFLKK